MDARITIFNNGLGNCVSPKYWTSQYGIDFGFSYAADGLLVDRCCGDGAKYFCYSVDGGETWEALVAGGIIRWPDMSEATIIFRNNNQDYPFLTCRVEKTDDFSKWEVFVRRHDFPEKSDIINAFKLKKLVGDIISEKVDFEDYSFVNNGADKASLYDFFVNHSLRATMQDEHISRALDRLKIYL